MSDDAMNVAADAAPVSDAGATGAEPTPSRDFSSEPTARSSIERAFAAMEAKNKAADTPVVVDDAQPGRDRNPDGTFKAADKPVEGEIKPQAEKVETKPVPTAVDAPSRFSADAKAAWATAPDAVKSEVTRAIRELEGGIQQYQQAFEPYKAFDQQLKQNGQTFQEVFDHYTGIEALLERDPLRGLDTICQNLGTSLKAIAAHVMEQPQDQQATQQDAVIRELRNEISELKKGLGGVSTTIKSQQEKALLSQIDEFSADPAHSRFDELSNDIVFFLNSGRTKDLKEAYELAERLNPAPVVAPTPAVQAAQPAAQAQTQKGQLSTTGAPSSGSNPAHRKPPASARDALDRAFAQTGL